MHAQWVRRFLDPSETHFKYLISHFIGWNTYPYALGTGFFDPAADEIPLHKELPSTFIQMMKSWRKVATRPDRSMLSAPQILAQNLFFNSDILCDGKPLGSEFLKVAEAGVNRISHLFNSNGTPIDIDTLRSTFPKLKR